MASTALLSEKCYDITITRSAEINHHSSQNNTACIVTKKKLYLLDIFADEFEISTKN